MITIKSPREIELMRSVGKLAAQCLKDMGKLVVEGACPNDIDIACKEWMAAHNAVAATYGYHNFPGHLCISVNDVVCHGIPSGNIKPFRNGDIVNLDVTPILDGYHGDTNATFTVGEVSEEAKRLIDTTHKAMWAGIRQVKPGCTLGDIGHAIQTVVESNGYSVVKEYGGHGIGRNFHEGPHVSHFGVPGQGYVLREGMTFTIEPMVNMGAEGISHDADGWTVRTADGSLSAQFEHTVLVTADGFEVLTIQEHELVENG